MARRKGPACMATAKSSSVTPSNGGLDLYLITKLHRRGRRAYPTGSVFVDANGNLYGTTLYGGTGTCSINQYTGCGVIWKITP